MYKNFFALGLCLLLFYGYTSAQQPVNFDFEKIDPVNGTPYGISSTQPNAYPLSVDSLIRQHGKYSAVLEQKDSNVQFGAFSFPIEPKFSGKKLTLKGYIRTENVAGGFAGLWLRVDGNSGVIGFDNMASQGLMGTNDWKEYTIQVDFNQEEAKSIYAGALLVGKGKIWLDNFHLLVDDKDYSFAPVLKRPIQKADLDTAFLRGSGLQFGELNKTKIDNLANLGMIWNASTQSQAEYTTMAFQSAPNVTVIGSITAGADGNVSAISLPGGVSTMISGLGVYYPDGTETQRKGVKIDIVMHPTIQGIREGKDELLDKAIEMIITAKSSALNK